MAERNVLYTRNPRTLRIPGVDYANARAISSGMAQLNQSLNRLTAFASQKNQQITAVKGAEYGAANAPTIEQINDAVKTGKDLDLPGSKTGTLFDRAVNKAAMEVFSDNIETIARNQITTKAITALENNTPIPDFRNDLDAIIQGYAGTFDESDPGFAQRFKARMGIVANAEYQSYAGQYRTKIEKEQKASFAAGFQITIKETLKKVMANGISVETRMGDAPGAPLTEKNVAITTEIISGMKEEIAQGMVKRGFDQGSIRTFLDVFDTKANEYAFDIIEEYILSADTEADAITMASEMMRGEMPENVRTALEVLGPEKRRDAQNLANETLEMFRKLESDKVKIKEETRKLLKADFDDSVARAAIVQLTDFELGKKMLDTTLDSYKGVLIPEVAEMMKNMPQIGDVTIPETSNFETKNLFTQDLFSNRPRFTIQTIINAFNEGNLSITDYEGFLDKYRLRANENFSRALTYGRTAFELNENFIVINPGGGNAKRINSFNKFEREMMEAREEDPTTFDAYKWAKENISRFVDETKNAELADDAEFLERNSLWTDMDITGAITGKIIKKNGETLTRKLANQLQNARNRANATKDN